MFIRKIGLLSLVILNLWAVQVQGSPSKARPVPVAVIDTTEGPLRCTLFQAERLAATAQFRVLAEGAKGGTDPISGAFLRGTPAFDGARIKSTPAGIRVESLSAGERSTDATLPKQQIPVLHFDRPGRMGFRRKKGDAKNIELLILDHANAEDDGEQTTVFGQCDDASVALVRAISHRLATTDDHPVTPIAIKHVAIVWERVQRREIPAHPPHVEDESAFRSWTVPGPMPTGPVAMIDTTMGTVSCRLFTKESPLATSVFIGLADGRKEWTNPVTKQVERGKRFYDGMVFDRVIPDFVIQTGDFTGDISGATDIGFHFKNENTPGLRFDRPGRLAFGNNGPDTNNSEIFIAEHAMRRLDGGFTIIGQCDDASVRLVEKIARVPRGAGNRPLDPVRIVHVSIVPQ